MLYFQANNIMKLYDSNAEKHIISFLKLTYRIQSKIIKLNGLLHFLFLKTTVNEALIF